MLRTLREIVDSLMRDVPGHIFTIKLISEENKALIIKDGESVVATLGSSKRIICELFNDEIYEQIKKQSS